MNLDTLSAIVNGPMSPAAFGLPNGFKMKREERPEIHAVVHTIGIDQTISVAVTDEAFMRDVHGHYVIPVVRGAALELAHIVRDSMDLYIKEFEE